MSMATRLRAMPVTPGSSPAIGNLGLRAWYVGIAPCAMVRSPIYCKPHRRRLPTKLQKARDQPEAKLTFPNLITLARILLVPVLVWAIASGEMLIAFLLFLVAGVSDLVDGFLAKRFGMTSEIGAYLDPLADKVLIVSIYVALGITGAIPRWLVILVVSRDIMIVGAVHPLVAGRQAGRAQAAVHLQAQYRRADHLRMPGACRARLPVRSRDRCRPSPWRW